MLSLSKEKLEYLLKYSPDGIHIIDSEGNLTFYSETFMINLGYENYDELLNFNVCDWDKDIDKAEYSQLIEALKQGPIEIERTHTRKNNTKYIAYITANLINIDNQSLLYASARDITEQKENERTIMNN